MKPDIFFVFWYSKNMNINFLISPHVMDFLTEFLSPHNNCKMNIMFMKFGVPLFLRHAIKLCSMTNHTMSLSLTFIILNWTLYHKSNMIQNRSIALLQKMPPGWISLEHDLLCIW